MNGFVSRAVGDTLVSPWISIGVWVVTDISVRSIALATPIFPRMRVNVAVVCVCVASTEYSPQSSTSIAFCARKAWMLKFKHAFCVCVLANVSQGLSWIHHSSRSLSFGDRVLVEPLAVERMSVARIDHRKQ